MPGATSAAPAAGGTATAGAGGGAGTVAGSAVPASVAPSSFSTGDIAAAQGIAGSNAGLAPSGASALAPASGALSPTPGAGLSLATPGLTASGTTPLAPSGLGAGIGGASTTPAALTPNLSSLTSDSIGLTSADTSAINATANGSVFNGLADSDILGGGSSLTGGGSSALGGGGAAATPAATGAASSGNGAFGGISGGSVLGGLKTAAPLLASGIGLLSSVKEGNKQPANYGTLESQAGQLQSQGNQLQGYLTSGTLPPGVQAGLNSARASAEATIKSQYASRGMSGSSAEAQDIANLNATVVAQGAQIATGLLQQGVSESEFASNIYSQLMQTSIQQDKDLSASIANFAGALGGAGLKALPTG